VARATPAVTAEIPAAVRPAVRVTPVTQERQVLSAMPVAALSAEQAARPAPAGSAAQVAQGPRSTPEASQAFYIRFAAERPNERWQADFTHWRLAVGTHVEIID